MANFDYRATENETFGAQLKAIVATLVSFINEVKNNPQRPDVTRQEFLQRFKQIRRQIG